MWVWGVCGCGCVCVCVCEGGGGGGGGGGALWWVSDGDAQTPGVGGGVKILCVAAELKNWGQKSICGHKKGGQYSMIHWKIGVKILCSKSWEGQNSMKAKIRGSKFYFFLVEPLVKILCSLKRGVKILYLFPVPWKRGVKTAEPTNQLHWRGAPLTDRHI